MAASSRLIAPRSAVELRRLPSPRFPRRHMSPSLVCRGLGLGVRRCRLVEALALVVRLANAAASVSTACGACRSSRGGGSCTRSCPTPRWRPVSIRPTNRFPKLIASARRSTWTTCRWSSRMYRCALEVPGRPRAVAQGARALADQAVATGLTQGGLHDLTDSAVKAPVLPSPARFPTDDSAVEALPPRAQTLHGDKHGGHHFLVPAQLQDPEVRIRVGAETRCCGQRALRAVLQLVLEGQTADAVGGHRSSFCCRCRPSSDRRGGEAGQWATPSGTLSGLSSRRSEFVLSSRARSSASEAPIRGWSASIRWQHRKHHSNVDICPMSSPRKRRGDGHVERSLHGADALLAAPPSTRAR